jgi:hypothetical protein
MANGRIAWSAALAVGLFILLPATAQQVRIGADARLPDNPRSHFSRYVNWRPADGETVQLNPPRMSWTYDPAWPQQPNSAQHTFRLQIAGNAAFTDCVVDVPNCPINFLNTIPVLRGADRWYWRVGYDIGTAREKWSETRSFVVSPEAVEWDRSALAKPDLGAVGHPRVLFTKENLPKVRALAKTHPASAAALKYMRAKADGILKKDWWDDFPTSDREPTPKQHFYTIAHDLATVCFVWVMTEDPKYAGVKERAVTWASYPPGGRASPEGLGGDGSEDATQGNEFLSLLFDWLYNDLNPEQRQIMIGSLEWRVDHWINSFAWRAKRGKGPLLRLTFYNAKKHLGDKRLYLATATEARQFRWEGKAPAEATRVEFELFNYYRGGTVRWSSPSLSGKRPATKLLNPTFSKPRKGIPTGWRFSSYRTGSTPELTPVAGRPGESAASIVCPTDGDRGSWQQAVKVTGGEKLLITGTYQTLDMSPAAINGTSLSGLCSSHQYEGSMDTAVCGLVLYEHSELGREWFDLILNYLIGITVGHGFDEAWNEGAGYGTSKCKWLMNATMYFDTALPEANLGKNPFYRRLGDWFCRVIPVGMNHHAWGNQANASRGNHKAHMRQFAHLTGDGRFLLNWKQYGGGEFAKLRPWIEYVLPAYYQEPKPVPETDGVALFPVAGWAMAAGGPPSLRSTFEQEAGIVFQCRSRGGFSHSFNSDGSFQLHAYGQMLNHGGGSSANRDACAYHTMSHNTLLIDGLGQAQTTRRQTVPTYGRIAAFARGKDYAYFAGDVTNCYPKKPGQYSRWSLRLHKVYEQRALPHLKRFVRHVLFVRNRYFVIFDDVASEKPATYTWLYHIRPSQELKTGRVPGRIDYRVGDVPVRLQHIAGVGELEIQDRKGLDGFVNPITGEDYTRTKRGKILAGHNLWISNRTPVRDRQFLAAIVPARPGEPLAEIRRLDDATVAVGTDIICFDPKSPHAGSAMILVDPAAIRQPLP